MNDTVFFAFTMCCCVTFGSMLEEDNLRGSRLALDLLILARVGLVVSGAVLAWRLVVEWLA